MASNVIYCFSGTGNCLALAKALAAGLGDTEIRSMRKEPESFDTAGAERVGFVFPCYAGGLPEKVAERVARVEIAPGAYTFAVVSYAGYPGCGPSIIDGLHPLDYWAGVQEPCSCIWLFPRDLTGPVDKTLRKAAGKAEKIAADLREKKTSRKPGKAALNRVESSVWPKLSKKKADALRADPGCVGCGQCARICPQGNIQMLGGRPQFGLDCIGCLGCLQYCPKQAISMGGVTVKRKRYHHPDVSADDLSANVIEVK